MKTTIVLLLAINLGYAQVLTTLPHIVEGVEYDHLPHDGIDHLPYTIGADPVDIYADLYYWALEGAGVVESLYLQDEEWQHECRITKTMMLRQIDSLGAIIVRCKQLWEDLEDAISDPNQLQYVQGFKPTALGRLDEVDLRRREYKQILLFPETLCAVDNFRLDSRISSMYFMRAHLEQKVMPIGAIFN